MEQLSIPPCPKCGHTRVTTDIAGAVNIVQRNRRSGILGTKNGTYIRALTCINCGYTELYAAQPEKLIPDL